MVSLFSSINILREAKLADVQALLNMDKLLDKW